MWKVTFLADVEAVRLPAVEIPLPEIGVDSLLRIASRGESGSQRFELTVAIGSGGSDDVVAVARTAIERFWDKVCVGTGGRFASLTFESAEETSSTGITIIPAPATVGVSAHIVVEIDAAAILEVAKKTWVPIAGAYRHALTPADPVVRFLGLYNVLLMLCEDKQPRVDALLWKLDHRIPTFKSRKRKKQESLFSKMRNQIAHYRAESSFESTRHEIKKHLQWFSSLVEQVVKAKS